MLRRAYLVGALISLLVSSPSLAAAQALKAGVVTTLEGDATVTRVALPPQPLTFKADVFVDDTVTTGDRSLVRLLLGGRAVVTVRERSALTITEVPAKATLDLAAGKIALAVAKEKMRPGESIEIRAANAVAGIRGTVVVVEVASAAATFWVLHGQIEASLANQAGSPVLVGALQQFRGGAVSNILPGEMARILQGLSSGKVAPVTGGDGQAREAGVSAGLALARSFTGVARGGALTVVPPLMPQTPTVPILPGNRDLPRPPGPSKPQAGGNGSSAPGGVVVIAPPGPLLPPSPGR